jgi:hypothetical protein
VPVYGAIMTLGVLGLIVPLMLYWYLYLLWKKSYQFLRKYYTQLIRFPADLLLIVTILYLLICKVTVEAYGLFVDFYVPTAITSFTILLGMWLGLTERLKSQLISDIGH